VEARHAQVAGVKIFRDQTCRPELVEEFTWLGVGFTQFDDGFGSNYHDLWNVSQVSLASEVSGFYRRAHVVSSICLTRNDQADFQHEMKMVQK